ncbi:MAG: LPS export ABC transporter permease LptG [Alphaproteobacteria bacterium]
MSDTQHLGQATHWKLSATLFGYLAKQYFLSIFMVTLALGLFVYLVDMLEILRKLGGKDNAIAAPNAFLLGVWKLPDMLLQIAPFALLLGTLAGLTRLTRNHELIALRAAGLPARTFLLPALVVCMGIGVFNVAALSPLAAMTLRKYERTMAELFPGSMQGVITTSGNLWLRQQEGSDDTFIYAKDMRDNGKTLLDVTLFTFSPEGDFMERLDARTMRWQPNLLSGQDGWRLESVFTLSATQKVDWVASADFPSPLNPSMIANSMNSPRTLTVWDMGAFITRLKQAGLPTQNYELYYHRLLASPALLLAMLLLAAPLALRFSRTRGLGQVMLVGLLLGFGFYLFSNIIAAYGLSGRLPAPMAAWAPTVVAGLIGFGLFVHFREE